MKKLLFILLPVFLLAYPLDSLDAQQIGKIISHAGKGLAKMKPVGKAKKLTLPKGGYKGKAPPFASHCRGTTSRQQPLKKTQKKTRIDVYNYGDLIIHEGQDTQDKSESVSWDKQTETEHKIQDVRSSLEQLDQRLRTVSSSSAIVPQDHSYDVMAGFFGKYAYNMYGNPYLADYTFAAQNVSTSMISFCIYRTNYLMNRQVGYSVVLYPGQVFTLDSFWDWRWQAGETVDIVYANGQIFRWQL